MAEDFTLAVARERARLGIAWLREHVPGGIDRIDLDELDMHCGLGRCALAQACGGVAWHVARERLLEVDGGDEQALGFNLPHEGSEYLRQHRYSVLTAAWRIELRALRTGERPTLGRIQDAVEASLRALHADLLDLRDNRLSERNRVRAENGLSRAMGQVQARIRDLTGGTP